jgi:hypothetical protein
VFVRHDKQDVVEPAQVAHGASHSIHTELIGV